MDQRLNALQQWLYAILSVKIIALHPIPGDASFRRYFRLQHEGRSLLAVDAPPATENSAAFVALSTQLHAAGVSVPAVLAADILQGFLLISDLGNQLYLQHVTNETADQFYKQALDVLPKIQQALPAHLLLPAFDRHSLLQELHFFQEWFLEQYVGVKLPNDLLQTTFNILIEAAEAQPQIGVHRDYHSRNLMVLSDGRIGILDFQDAVWGPVTYDAVSLLRDCYIDWPDPQIKQWSLYYFTQLCERGILKNISFEQYTYWFDLMGIQRHLKALFIFARKQLRDAVPHYVIHMPRTLSYVLAISQRYPALANFYEALTTHVVPRMGLT